MGESLEQVAQQRRQARAYLARRKQLVAARAEAVERGALGPTAVTKPPPLLPPLRACCCATSPLRLHCDPRGPRGGAVAAVSAPRQLRWRRRRDAAADATGQQPPPHHTAVARSLGHAARRPRAAAVAAAVAATAAAAAGGAGADGHAARARGELRAAGSVHGRALGRRRPRLAGGAVISARGVAAQGRRVVAAHVRAERAGEPERPRPLKLPAVGSGCQPHAPPDIAAPAHPRSVPPRRTRRRSRSRETTAVARAWASCATETRPRPRASSSCAPSGGGPACTAPGCPFTRDVGLIGIDSPDCRIRTALPACTRAGGRGRTWRASFSRLSGWGMSGVHAGTPTYRRRARARSPPSSHRPAPAHQCAPRRRACSLTSTCPLL